ncbi:Similar to molybdopterin cofactor sulfurase [Arabidopsis thaliana]|nr:Similar to molybdopterin cofactor sulfurase [Arabidopsis thaliana]
MEAFLKEFGDYYGYPDGPKNIQEIRDTEFKRLDKDYSCLFTSGATAALKLVGETFPWTQDSNFLYTMENHNSVLGIREYALAQGASACAVDIEEAANQPGQLTNSGPSIKVKHRAVQMRNTSKLQKEESRGNAYNLFAFPSECNFSGLRFNLDLVKLMKENTETVLQGSPFSKSKRWMVLIDAAKGCATLPPDLSEYPADFVVLSFYKLCKMVEFVWHLMNIILTGTVAASIADIDFVKRRERVEEFFEDGSASFLSIAAIRHGFKLLKSLTPSAIWMHTTSLSIYVKKKLQALRHGNGAAVCVLYGSENLELSSHKSGPTVTFNLKRPDGSWFGYLEVEKLASLSGIQLRAGHICWDDNDVINGKPTGAVRVSFGYMSTFEDAKKFIDFIISSFASPPKKTGNGTVVSGRFPQLPSEDLESKESFPSHYLKSITVYPIKSCAGFSVIRWPLCRTGLLHDREWMVQGLTGEILTQKKVPEMSLIKTFIDLEEGLLSVESSRCEDKLHIRIKSDSYNPRNDEFDSHANILENRNEETRINRWFTNAIGRQCKLLRYSSSTSKDCLNRNKSPGLCRDLESNINFANEAQFLLISEESVADLNRRLEAKDEDYKRAHEKLNPHRFRPNLVISGGEPYGEDKWKTVKIGDNHFTGKILFGTLLRYEIDEKRQCWIGVGEEVNPDIE